MRASSDSGLTSSGDVVSSPDAKLPRPHPPVPAPHTDTTTNARRSPPRRFMRAPPYRSRMLQERRGKGVRPGRTRWPDLFSAFAARADLARAVARVHRGDELGALVVGVRRDGIADTVLFPRGDGVAAPFSDVDRLVVHHAWLEH